MILFGISAPPPTGDKLDSQWLGPAEVVERTSKRGYAIRIKPGLVIDSPFVFLKKYIPDVYSGEEILMHFHKRTPLKTGLEADETTVERVVGHKQLGDGSWRFLTKWEGERERTWEPISSFITNYNTDLIAYCKDNHIDLDLVTHLRSIPTA